MLASTKDEIGETPTYAFAFVRPITKPCGVIFCELRNRGIAIGTTDAINASWAKTSIHITKMLGEIWQMFDNMVGIKCGDRTIVKRQRLP